MSQLVQSTADPATVNTDVLVIGLYKGDDGPVLAPAAAALTTAWGNLAATFDAMGATGTSGSTTKIPSLGKVAAELVIGVGLGEPDESDTVDTETLRRAAGAAVRAAAGHDSVFLALDGDSEEIALGALLGSYRFAGYKSDDTDRKEPVGTISVLADNVDFSRVEAIANGVTIARDWSNTPANMLRPPSLADQVSEAATAAGLDVEVLDEADLAAGRYGGLLAVGMGSAAPPRLVRLAYRHPEATRHVALVGKGITFDTGGISIKPTAGMWDMKGDMAGAAAVAGAMLAIARIGPAVNVTAYLALAENMVSGHSYRPGDVITAYGGKTIEVLNTDAEGRMVLADALVRAGEDAPDVIYDTATLTGGQVISLGKRTAGLMGTDDETARVKAVGDRIGEPGWPMPMPEEIRKNMESSIADVLQCQANLERSGHMLQGGIFLSHFVDDDTPWAHIDIAGPADSGEAYGYITKGATGRPVRTLVELVNEHATL